MSPAVAPPAPQQGNGGGGSSSGGSSGGGSSGGLSKTAIILLATIIPCAAVVSLLHAYTQRTSDSHHVCKRDAATPPASSRSLLIRLGQFCKRICSLVMCHYLPKIWVTSCDRNGLLKGMIAHACLAPQKGVCVCRWRQL